jgi:hypothetical protein
VRSSSLPLSLVAPLSHAGAAAGVLAAAAGPDDAIVDAVAAKFKSVSFNVPSSASTFVALRWDSDGTEHTLRRPTDFDTMVAYLKIAFNFDSANDTIYFFPNNEILADAVNRVKIESEGDFIKWNQYGVAHPELPKIWVYPRIDVGGGCTRVPDEAAPVSQGVGRSHRNRCEVLREQRVVAAVAAV